MLLLSQLGLKGGQERRECAFVLYSKFSPQMDGVSRALACFTLRCSTADEVDHSYLRKKRWISARKVSTGKLFVIEDEKA